MYLSPVIQSWHMVVLPFLSATSSLKRTSLPLASMWKAPRGRAARSFLPSSQSLTDAACQSST